MPKGITQDQVNTAADALMAAGEKPTVEKIRAALGTGSPNTVTRMLETWRNGLAERLQNVLQLPDVPAEAGQAFAEVWRLAVTHAQSLAQASLAQEQNALLAAQTSITQERKIWEIAIAQAQANAVDLATQLKHVELRLTERQALLTQTESQRHDLLQQRDRLQQQHDRLAEELVRVRTQCTTSESKAAAEREQTNAHIRHIEDRASREIDHARQDCKALQQRLDTLQRDHAKALAHLATEQDASQSALRGVEQQLATERGRAEALQQQLAQKPRVKPPSTTPRKKDAGRTASTQRSTKKR